MHFKVSVDFMCAKIVMPLRIYSFERGAELPPVLQMQVLLAGGDHSKGGAF
jgi:hypothetical protein